MVNDEILGGLKAAVERGQSIKGSINAFINAGYSEEVIKAETEAKAYLKEYNIR